MMGEKPVRVRLRPVRECGEGDLRLRVKCRVRARSRTAGIVQEPGPVMGMVQA